jgi:hypothetical protein
MARILKKGNDVFYNEAQVTAAVRLLSLLLRQWLLRHCFLTQAAGQSPMGDTSQPDYRSSC